MKTMLSMPSTISSAVSVSEREEAVGGEEGVHAAGVLSQT